MAALGIAGRWFARGAVHAGRAAFYQRAGQMAGRVAQAAARPAVRRAMGAQKSCKKMVKGPTVKILNWRIRLFIQKRQVSRPHNT